MCAGTQYVQVKVECDVVPDYTICAGRGRVGRGS